MTLCRAGAIALADGPFLRRRPAVPSSSIPPCYPQPLSSRSSRRDRCISTWMLLTCHTLRPSARAHPFSSFSDFSHDATPTHLSIAEHPASPLFFRSVGPAFYLTSACSLRPSSIAPLVTLRSAPRCASSHCMHLRRIYLHSSSFNFPADLVLASIAFRLCGFRAIGRRDVSTAPAVSIHPRSSASRSSICRVVSLGLSC